MFSVPFFISKFWYLPPASFLRAFCTPIPEIASASLIFFPLSSRLWSLWHLAFSRQYYCKEIRSFGPFDIWYFPPTVFWHRINFTTFRVARHHLASRTPLFLCYFAHLTSKNVCLCSACTLERTCLRPFCKCFRDN